MVSGAQPPDAENRMSSGVGWLTGEIQSACPDLDFLHKFHVQLNRLYAALALLKTAGSKLVHCIKNVRKKMDGGNRAQGAYAEFK